MVKQLLPKGRKVLNSHLFICGRTRSGKTTLANDLYLKLDGDVLIFVNTQLERSVEDASDIVVENLEDIVKAINDGKTRICYNPPEDKEKIIKTLIELKTVLFTVGKVMTDKKPRIWCYIFIDEIWQFGEDLNVYFTRGARFGITAVAISQRPAEVSHTVLTQCFRHVIFDLSPYETPYFERYHIPLEDFKHWIDKPYHYVSFDGKTTIYYAPVKI